MARGTQTGEWFFPKHRKFHMEMFKPSQNPYTQHKPYISSFSLDPLTKYKEEKLKSIPNCKVVNMKAIT